MTEPRRTALVTGVVGQDGILLSQLLLAQGYDVWGLSRAAPQRWGLLRSHAPDVIALEGDIRDTATVREALERAQPDEVYNLAAFSSVARSWDSAAEVMEVNALAVVGLLDAIRDARDSAGREIRFYQASSSEMFGSPGTAPQDETTSFHPRSPYGVSKTAAHHLTVNYRESYGLYACSGILYNHESALREPHFVTRKISLGVAAIAQGRADHIELGNLDVSRDWGSAHDFVRAMWLMLQQTTPDDYVIATGRSHTLGDFLTAAFSHIGITDWTPYVRSNEALVRPAEVTNLVGNPARARSVLGWSPTRTFTDVVASMVEHDLQVAPDLDGVPR